MADLELAIARVQGRGDVENVFSRYMHYHNAFEDDRIVDELWVRRGTEGVRAQYNNDGVYTDWDTVMAYHRGRPRPVGKLILHYTSTPVIEVSADATTAKGLWMMTGVESGLTDPAEAANVPPFFFSPADVDGRKVWAHWVWAIAFAAHSRADYESKLMYFGDDGKPVFLPPVEGPGVTPSYPYGIDRSQDLTPEPPKPYDDFEDTFR